MSLFHGGRNFPVLCVTGPMAAGKNLAASILEKKGWACVDADKSVHVALEQLKPQIVALHKAEAERLGISLVKPDGSLDRRAVGRIVFANPAALRAQEALLYPQVCRQMRQFIDSHPNQPVALNATVLYKTPELLSACDFVLFVDAPWLVRLFRSKKRDGLPFSQILSRFQSQRNIFAKYKKSNADIYRVWNIGFPYALERRIERMLLLWNRKKPYGLSQE